MNLSDMTVADALRLIATNSFKTPNVAQIKWLGGLADRDSLVCFMEGEKNQPQFIVLNGDRATIGSYDCKFTEFIFSVWDLVPLN